MTWIPGIAEHDRLYRDPALGCGTGRLTVTLVDGNTEVVGVDPAAAMLDVARAKSGGGAVEWIQGDARALRLNRRFDLVLLTGHAFQVFLTSANQVAVLRTIAAHPLCTAGGTGEVGCRGGTFGRPLVRGLELIAV